MEAALHYEINTKDRDFSRRMMRFVKHNIWFYIPDIILLVILILPPYEMQKTLMIISGLVVLGFRDLIVLRRSTYYLNRFIVEEQMVSFSVMKYNQIFFTRQNHISNVELTREYKPYRLVIRENNEVVHIQYAIGYWNRKKLKDLYERFNNLKQDISIESMFKGNI